MPVSDMPTTLSGIGAGWGGPFPLNGPKAGGTGAGLRADCGRSPVEVCWMRSFAGRDILSLKDFERAEFMHVFDVAGGMEPIARERRNTDLLAAKTLVTAFYQPSTRTRLAHEAALHPLAGDVVGCADPKMTRAGDFYQESIKDTAHMLEYYGDASVMRHFQQGAPAAGASWCCV